MIWFCLALCLRKRQNQCQRKTKYDESLGQSSCLVWGKQASKWSGKHWSPAICPCCSPGNLLSLSPAQLSMLADIQSNVFYEVRSQQPHIASHLIGLILSPSRPIHFEWFSPFSFLERVYLLPFFLRRLGRTLFISGMCKQLCASDG